MKHRFLKALTLTVLLATASVTVPAVADAAEQTPSVINVTGYAEQEVAPDTAYITIGMESTANDVQKARSENNLVMNQVTNAVKALGVTKDDLRTTDFNMTPNYDTNGRKIVSYTVTNNLRIRVSDFDLIPRIIEKAGQAGANRVMGMTFTNEHADTIKNNLIKEAVHNGRSAAEAAAMAAGGQLGKVKEINISGRTPSYSRAYAGAMNARLMKVEATDMAPVEAGTNTLSETVSMTFYIQ